MLMDMVENRTREAVQTAVANIQAIAEERDAAKARWLEERDRLNGQIKDAYSDAKTMGINTKALRDAIKRLQDGPPDAEHEALIDQYTLWLGDIEPKLIKAEVGMAADDEPPLPLTQPLDASADAVTAAPKATPAAKPKATAADKPKAKVAAKPKAKVALPNPGAPGRGPKSDFKLVHGGEQPGTMGSA